MNAHAVRRCHDAPSLWRPMSEFDPSEPVLLHDRRRNRTLPWSPAFQHSYNQTARELSPGVMDYDGLLLDGWMIPEDVEQMKPA
jgi:hypothetical protein